jgi:hypothetical protein
MARSGEHDRLCIVERAKVLEALPVQIEWEEGGVAPKTISLHNRTRSLNMKKLALIAATLICFAGCARNDTGDMTEDTSGTSTAVGTPATTQSESSISTDTNSSSINEPSILSADTNSTSSTLNQDTNNVGQANGVQSYPNSTPPPTPPSPEQQQPQQGQQPLP